VGTAVHPNQHRATSSLGYRRRDPHPVYRGHEQVTPTSAQPCTCADL